MEEASFSSRVAKAFGGLGQWSVSNQVTAARGLTRRDSDVSDDDEDDAFEQAFQARRLQVRDNNIVAQGDDLACNFLEDEEDAETEGFRMRQMVGMDQTLDQEEEEDEHDRVATGMRDDDKVWMGGVAASRGGWQGVGVSWDSDSFGKSLPGNLEELRHQPRDSRADRSAAAARIARDAAELAEAEAEARTNNGVCQEPRRPQDEARSKSSSYGMVGIARIFDRLRGLKEPEGAQQKAEDETQRGAAPEGEQLKTEGETARGSEPKRGEPKAEGETQRGSKPEWREHAAEGETEQSFEPKGGEQKNEGETEGEGPASFTERSVESTSVSEEAVSDMEQPLVLVSPPTPVAELDLVGSSGGEGACAGLLVPEVAVLEPHPLELEQSGASVSVPASADSITRMEIAAGAPTDGPEAMEAMEATGGASVEEVKERLKVKKRVRFAPDVKGGEDEDDEPQGGTGRLDMGQGGAMGMDWEPQVGVSRPQAERSRRKSVVPRRLQAPHFQVVRRTDTVPDYVKNPQKYTCYSLDWRDEEDEGQQHVKALEAARVAVALLRSNDSPVKAVAGEERVQTSITFVPKRKASVELDEGSETKKARVQSSLQPKSIAEQLESEFAETNSSDEAELPGPAAADSSGSDQNPKSVFGVKSGNGRSFSRRKQKYRASVAGGNDSP